MTNDEIAAGDREAPPVFPPIFVSKYSAADSALGYLYQCRFALLSALRRVRSGDDFSLYLETLDDVVFQSEGPSVELLQLKHHRKRASNLTDTSQDLWKTLRIWCEGMSGAQIPAEALLYLVTTSMAPNGSAASYLRADDRNVDEAVKRLRSAGQSSTSQVNQPCYAAFNALSRREQQYVLSRVVIIDASPSIVDLETDLRKEIRWAVNRQFIEPFLHRLEGWWFVRAIRQLSGKSGFPVASGEFGSQMDDLREQFRMDALPVDNDILAAEVDESAYQDAIFVRQLQLIGVSARRIVAAIREYFRAFEQRSRWQREDLLGVGELEKYERSLVEEWELAYERMKDDVDPSAAEKLKQKAAQELYRWVEEKVIPIRPHVTEAFVTRGSYQMLSDCLRVGWHPEFKLRLQSLLGVKEVAS